MTRVSESRIRTGSRLARDADAPSSAHGLFYRAHISIGSGVPRQSLRHVRRPTVMKPLTSRWIMAPCVS